MFAAIEIGGTKLQLGLHCGETTDGRWVPWHDFRRRDVDPDSAAEGIRSQIIEVLSDWQNDGIPIDAIGVGFGGPVNNGRVITSHQISGWDDFPLAAWLTETFDVATTDVANDCDTAALAEATHGVGQGSRTVFFVTVGTGVGGGLVIDGLVHGGQPAAGEIGHLRPGLQAATARETVESVSSGWGIANTARNRLRRGGAETDSERQILTRAGSIDAVDSRLLAELAMSGNDVAREAIELGVRTLGWAIAQVVTLVSPNVVVLGGGVSLMNEALFLNPLRRAVEQYVFPPLKESYRLLPAALGEEVVVRGALTLAGQAGTRKSRHNV
ncbi:MAG: ROK family protein [Pirellulaceae bacterium]